MNKTPTKERCWLEERITNLGKKQGRKCNAKENIIM